MIFEKERHLPVTDVPWSADQAREMAGDIFDFICKRQGKNGLWPRDPDSDGACEFEKTLYSGATGTVWSLVELSRRLDRKLPFDARELSVRIYGEYVCEPDTGSVVPSFFLGDTAIMLLRHKLGAGEGVVKQARTSIESNTRNPVNEALWGSPGTMIPALRLEQFDLYRAGADYLFEVMHKIEDPARDFWIWTQDLYGRTVSLSGAGHGFFGNVYALLEGAEHLAQAQRDLIFERTVETALRSARREGGLANWMPNFMTPPDEKRGPLTQWCHGAPGVLTALRSFPKNYSEEFETLLLEAGETVWQAGPLTKGISLCHGTDGNGYALLQLFERTGDEKWLERARKFAMHAMTQRNGRFSLWTGEAGLALYLLDCVDGKAGLPSLDYF